MRSDVYTVELLLDAELENGVRDLWFHLRDAGLKSLADHPHPTNRPHLTVVTAASLAGLQPLALPIAAKLGPVRFLGRALVREVTPTKQLLGLQADVWSALRDAESWPPPPEWIPHVSLALKVPEGQRSEALRTLSALPSASGNFVAARSYDTLDRGISTL